MDRPGALPCPSLPDQAVTPYRERELGPQRGEDFMMGRYSRRHTIEFDGGTTIPRRTWSGSGRSSRPLIRK